MADPDRIALYSKTLGKIGSFRVVPQPGEPAPLASTAQQQLLVGTAGRGWLNGQALLARVGRVWAAR